jgi:hypothetical protein
VQFTLEELELVLRIVKSAQLTGTAESLRAALAVHASILAKVIAASEQPAQRRAQVERMEMGT